MGNARSAPAYVETFKTTVANEISHLNSNIILMHFTAS